MARNVVAGNWKMNLLAGEAHSLLVEVEKNSVELDCELIVCPPAPYLQTLANQARMSVGAQNVASEESGAFTGEWSAKMLGSIGVSHCIVGHSERRSLFGESDENVNKKTKQLLNNNIVPIVCCGESLSQRENNQQNEIVAKQITAALAGISDEEIRRIIIAYEPVWAIGTGVTASTNQAQEMHAFIRDLLTTMYSSDAADNIPLLYGGSCKPENAKELFSCKDIDGGLIGGAALKSDSFLAIASSF